MTHDNIDIDQASRFLSILDPSGNFTFQTYDERTAGEKDNRLSKILHGTLKEKQSDLVRISNAGGSVFVAINETDGKGRRTENITAIRALRLDLDGSPLDPVKALDRLKPHLIIETSPERYHCIWLIKSCPLDHYSAYQRALADKFGGDGAVDGLERCARVPGFFHRKKEPFMVRLVEGRGTQPYELEWVRKWLDPKIEDDGEAKKGKKGKSSKRSKAQGADEKVALHHRHTAMQTAGGRLRNAGFSAEPLFDALLAWNVAHCEPPIPEDEVRDYCRWLDTKETGSLAPTAPKRKDDAQAINLKPPDKEEIEKSRDLVREVIGDLRSDGTMYLEDASLSAVLVLEANRKTDESDRKVLAELFTAAKRKHVHRELSRILKEKRETRPTGEAFTQPVADALEYVPEECQDHEFPENFTVFKGKLVLVKAGDGGLDYRDVCERPFLVAGQSVDVETGTISLTLKHETHEGWRTVEIPRANAFDARKLTETAAVGMSIGSYNAALAARFVAQYCAVNDKLIKTDKIISHLGWTPDGKTFVTGDRSIGADPAIRFKGNDYGDSEVAHGFRCEGSRAAWLEKAQPAMRYPRIRALAYAALTSVMLRVYGMSNFLVSLPAPTSSGKTVVLRFVASMFGNPDEKSEGSLIHGFNMTKVGIERLAASQSDLPLFLDDLQSGNTKLINSLVYALVNGTGKTRGSLSGRQRTLRWRIVGLVTGEADLASYCSDGGSRARVLSLPGLPFDACDESTALFVSELDATCKRHYGHIFPELVQYVLDHKEEWEQWREVFRKESTSYGAKTGIEARMADMVAAIATTGRIAHDAGVFPWAFSDPFEGEIWKGVAESTRGVDIGKRALEDLYSWAFAHPSMFQDRGGYNEPVRGWVGRWPNLPTWGYIAFSRPSLREIMTSLGYDVEAVLTSWKHHNWLDCTGGRLTKCVRINEDAVDRMYVLKREGIKAALGRDVNEEIDDEDPQDTRDFCRGLDVGTTEETRTYQ